MNKKVVRKGLLPYLFLAVFLFAIIMIVGSLNKEVHEFNYGDFTKQVEKKDIKEITVTPRSRGSVYTITGKLKDYKSNESFVLTMPLTNETMVKLLEAEDEAGFKMKTTTDPESSTLLLFIIQVLPMVLLIGLGFWFITRQMGGNNKSMDFGKSKARLSGGDSKVTFKDVAGLTEEK